MKLTVAFLVAALTPFSAQALTFSSGNDTTLPFLALESTGTNTGTIGGGNVTGLITGGQVYSESVGGVAAQPSPDSGNFLGAGPSATSPATITFDQSLSYVSFLWGTPDSYNELVVNYLLNGVAQSTTFTTNDAALGLVAGGSSSYVQFLAGAGEKIASLQFVSNQNAFEAANFQAVAAPGPIAGAGLLPLLGLAGAWFARRRKALAA